MREKRIIQRVTRIPTRLSVCGLIILCIFMVQIGSAAIFMQDGTEIPGDQLIETMTHSNNISETPFPIQFFYNSHCGSCHAALDYLNEFTINNPYIVIQYHDLNNSSENSTLFDQYKGQFNRSHIHYPVIFVGNVGITGSDDIAAYTEPLSLWYQKNVKVDPLTGLFSMIMTSIRGKQ